MYNHAGIYESSLYRLDAIFRFSVVILPPKNHKSCALIWSTHFKKYLRTNWIFSSFKLRIEYRDRTSRLLNCLICSHFFLFFFLVLLRTVIYSTSIFKVDLSTSIGVVSYESWFLKWLLLLMINQLRLLANNLLITQD